LRSKAAHVTKQQTYCLMPLSAWLQAQLLVLVLITKADACAAFKPYGRFNNRLLKHMLCEASTPTPLTCW
jgi:hypothetical protein